MATTETEYIDKNDPALQAVEDEKQTAIDNSNKLIDDAIAANDSTINSLIEQNKAAAADLEKSQQGQTDFTIDQIEQQKAQAEKDYTKEQSASYVDWQKQSGKYGANAEAMAARGMSGTGYSESAQVSMYNTYQNRVAVARDSLTRAKLEYDNGIKEAKLANSSALAKIKADAFAQQLELSLQGLQYKNSMLLQKAQQQLNIESTYNSKYMDVYDQLYKEAALKEEARQFDKTFEAQYGDGKGLTTDNDVSLVGGVIINGGPSGEAAGPITNEKRDEIVLGSRKGSGSDVTDVPTNDVTTDKMVSTPYYNGKINPDAEKFDTFSNGYQPKGISGHGLLKKSGYKMKFDAITLDGEVKEVNQNIWEAADGTYWLWDGTNNQYQKLSETDVAVAAFGTFDNGYQPMGIVGYGKLSKTGYTTKINGQTQNVWKTPDGKQWVWDGKQNKYVDTIRSAIIFNPFH